MFDIRPTTGYSTKRIVVGQNIINTIEIGGDVENLWHFKYVDGVVHVVDASAAYKDIMESQKLLEKVVKSDFAKGKPLLVLGNKQSGSGMRHLKIDAFIIFTMNS